MEIYTLVFLLPLAHLVKFLGVIIGTLVLTAILVAFGRVLTGRTA